jgi:hypothetical protein
LPAPVCLLPSPVATDFEDPELTRNRRIRSATLAPKLGVLTLAGVLEDAGIGALLFDLDGAYSDFLREACRWGVEEFPRWVATHILATGARLFGFSSICNSYPVTLRIAAALKRCDPECTVLLGGPQASATDLATLQAFPYIDFVLRGEADHSLLTFIEELNGPRRFARVPGLTWRSPFGPQRNPDGSIIDDLDHLPLPAFHLSPDLQDANFTFLELGRGCPFSCTFCSTNDFFRRRFRVKSPERMIADMRHMNQIYGFRGFNLVHDMFTVDRRRVAQFCEAMLESGSGFEWSCSARTDCVDDDLLKLMARAGCNGIFFGIETGSKRMQRIIDKDLDPAQNRAMVEAAERLGIVTTVSVIIGFPEETEDDLRQSLDVYVHALRQPHAVPQAPILAPLSGTPVYSQYKDRMVLEDLGSPVAYPGRSHSISDRELIRNHPHIFPNFYLLPSSVLDHAALQELSQFLPMCRDRLRWLLIALCDRNSGVLPVFRAWREYRSAIRAGLDSGGLRQYYDSGPARRDFLSFVRSNLARFGSESVEALLVCAEAIDSTPSGAPHSREGAVVNGRLSRRDIPMRTDGVHVLELDWDIQGIIGSLKSQTRPNGFRVRKYYRTDIAPGGKRLVEVSPLVARALLLCDGRRNFEQFSAEAACLFDCPSELRSYAARRLLVQLRRKGLVAIYRTASRAQAAGS